MKGIEIQIMQSFDILHVKLNTIVSNTFCYFLKLNGNVVKNGFIILYMVGERRPSVVAFCFIINFIAISLLYVDRSLGYHATIDTFTSDN